MTKTALIALAAISYLSILSPVSANADECMALWKERNAIFHSYGYCFGGNLGKNYFGNDGCSTKNPSLNARDKKIVTRLKAREKRLGCRAQLKSWTIAKLRADDGPTLSKSTEPAQTRPTAAGDNLAIEQNLASLGFNPGTADGIFDQQTIAAINAFQRQYGLPTSNTLPPEQLVVLNALANVKSANRNPELESGDTEPVQAEGLAEASDPLQQSRSRPLRNPNASQVHNDLMPELKLELVRDHAALYESSTGRSWQVSYLNWLAWMHINLPILVPEILETNEGAALSYANLILSDQEKRAFQIDAGLDAGIFMPGENYVALPPGEHASGEFVARTIQKNIDLISRHASTFIVNELDEFTRDIFFSRLRTLLKGKLSEIQPTLPMPLLQIYQLTLGEYDFENRGFPIENIMGGGNGTAHNPVYTIMSGFVDKAYRNNNVSTHSDLQEFPLFLPIEPEAAKALLERLAQYRGDDYRTMYFGVFGELASITGELTDADDRKPINISVNLSVRSLEVSLDPEFNEIVHTIKPDKVTADDTKAMAALAANKPLNLFDQEYLVSSLSDEFPDMAQSNDLLANMLRQRIQLEQADLEPFGLESDQVQRFVRDELKQGVRKPNTDDFTKYRAYLGGLKSGEAGDTILLPISAYVRTGDDKGKTIEPGQPLDLIARGLEGIASNFGGNLTNNHSHRNLLQGRRLTAEPGTILMAAGSVPSDQKREPNIPVFLSVRVGKAQANAPLTLEQPLLTDAHNSFNRNSGPFVNPRYDWEINGHIVLELTKAPELVTFGAASTERAIIYSVTPQEAVLVDRDQEHRFSLAEEAGSKAAADPSIQAPDSLYFDAETADLVMARHQPETLTDAEIHRMMLARWHYESSFGNIDDTPIWGRFFEFRQEKPDTASVASLTQPFRKWTLARAAALPDKFQLNLPYLDLGKAGLAQFGSTLIKPIIPNIYLQSCQSRIQTFPIGKHGVDHQVEMLRNACKYISQAIALPESTLYLGRLDHLFQESRSRNISSIEYDGMSRFGTVGVRAACQRLPSNKPDVYCQKMQAELQSERFIDHQFVLDDILVLDKYLSVPGAVTRSENRRGANTRITFRIAGITRSDELVVPPFKAAAKVVDDFLVEQEIRDKASINDLEKPFPPVVPTNRFQLELISAEYYGGKIEEVFGALELIPDAPQPDPALLQPVKRKQIAPVDAPYGADIVGLQLGMTFDAADKIIRDHMDVGRVLIADRAWSTFEAFGNIQPFSSARLYESRDEKEVIVIFDEAPSASRIIMGLTRQVVFDKGTVKPAQIIRSLTKKYGAPDHNQNSAQYWGEYDTSCAPSSSAFSTKSIWRNEDGSETDWNIFKLGKRSGIATPDDIEERDVTYGENCSHGLMATFDASSGSDWDQFTLRLFDKETYRTHFIQSKSMIEEGVPLSGTEAVEEEIDLKL